MIISQQGEACSPNDDINALDLNGTKPLRDSLLKIKANSAGGDEALLAGAEIELEQEKQGEEAKIGQARQALREFRDYLAQSSGIAANALPREEELEYNYNPETKECEITRLDGQDIELDLRRSSLQGELPLPPQLMVTELHCDGNDLTALLELPPSLTLLTCGWNQLTALPNLPVSLAELYCANNYLTTLPKLPDNLAIIICYANQLTTLPELPDSLTELDFNINQLTALPTLPTSLTKLSCWSNQLTALPVLPASLTALYCSNNKLTALPELPDSLTLLTCGSNQLTSLPELPESLTSLDFTSNQLTFLPKLPDSLTGLWCGENPSLANDPDTQATLRAMSGRGVNVRS